MYAIRSYYARLAATLWPWRTMVSRICRSPRTELVDVKDSRRNGIRRHWHSRASFGLNGLFDALDHDASDPKLIERLLVEPLLVVADAQFIADDPGDVTWSAIRDNGRSRVAVV